MRLSIFSTFSIKILFNLISLFFKLLPTFPPQRQKHIPQERQELQNQRKLRDQRELQGQQELRDQLERQGQRKLRDQLERQNRLKSQIL